MTFRCTLTLEWPGYLKQPMGKIDPLLEYTDFQGTMINDNVV